MFFIFYTDKIYDPIIKKNVNDLHMSSIKKRKKKKLISCVLPEIIPCKTLFFIIRVMKRCINILYHLYIIRYILLFFFLEKENDSLFEMFCECEDVKRELLISLNLCY